LRYIGKDVQGAAELLYEHAKSVLKVATTNATAAARPAPRNLPSSIITQLKASATQNPTATSPA
jgi:hypothetical protein